MSMKCSEYCMTIRMICIYHARIASVQAVHISADRGCVKKHLLVNKNYLEENISISPLLSVKPIRLCPHLQKSHKL